MWAGSFVVRIGEERDLLVRVQFDTTDSLDLARALFEPWIEPAPPADPELLAPAFSVRLDPAAGLAAGPRPVPQLRLGSTVMARSREPDDVLRALASVLGGAHLHRRDDGRLWMGLRPFVRGGSMVLVDADRPTMVNDRQLESAGIHELAVWSTVIEPDGGAVVPPSIAGVDWGRAGVASPHDDWQRFALAGIVTLRGSEATQASIVADLAQRSIDRRWFALVTEMSSRGRLMTANGRLGLRDRLRSMLDVGGAERA